MSEQGYWNVVDPTLKGLGRKHINIFLKARQQYLLLVKDAEASVHSLLIVPLISCVDHDLLLSLIIIDCLPTVKDFVELTDDIRLNYLKSKEELKPESVSVDELEAAIRSAVKIDVHEPDTELRIQEIFTDHQTTLWNKTW